MTVHPSDLPEPIVLWAMPVSHARELWEHLHYHRPGGYGYDHDQLLEAINKAEGGAPKRTQDGYVEVRSAEQILAQLRDCIVEADAAIDEENEYLVRIHHQNGMDSARDLDNLLSDNKSAPLPADWQRN